MPEEPDLELGAADASGWREYERRRTAREAMTVIGGRDMTKLVDGLARQAGAVQSALDSVAPGVPVQACFCFVNPEGQSGGTKLPLLHTLSVSGYPLLYPRKLAKRLKQSGETCAEQRRLVAEALAREFPAA